MEYLLIEGDRVPASSREATTLADPATGEAWIDVAAASAEDVDRAVRVADRARKGWRKINSRDRTRILLTLAALIEEHAEELARLESRNVGKPIRDARDEVQLAANCFQYYAGAIDKVGGQTIPAAASGISLTFREPIGVCGLIAPWNFPIAITAWKVAPALAMGNTIVLKPASQTPLSALRLGEREEIFGPVVCAIPFDTEAEAVSIANNSPYGLSGSIWTRDISRALRVAQAIETGVLSINTGHSVHLEAPFGGVKRSGVGRKLGLVALDHYSELKSVFIAE